VDVERLEDADGGLPALGAHVVRVRVGVERDLPAGLVGTHARPAIIEPLDEGLALERGELAAAVDAESPLHQRASGAGLCDPVREGRERRPELRERVEVPEQAFLQVDAAGLFVRSEPLHEEVEVAVLPAVDAIANDGVDPRDVDLHRTLVHTPTTPRTEVVELGGAVLSVDAGLPAGGDAAGVRLAAERVPADVLEVRTRVRARRTPDAVQRLPELVVLAHLHPTVVDEHEVELAVVAGFKLSLAEGR